VASLLPSFEGSEKPRWSPSADTEMETPRVVLVVDDEPLILSLTSAMLEDLGCEVLSADSGADALAQLALDPRVGLLLTDIQMPGMSGYELAAEVRQHWPELPIAVMSGNDVGCHGYSVVRKPFSQPQLAQVVDATWN
jgi:two-component system, cell cycle response regulator CpdR